MWRLHILTFSPTYDRQKIINAIDIMPEVVNWRAASGAIFLVTADGMSSDDLANRIIRVLPDLTFIIGPFDAQESQGKADRKTWEFITNPRPVGQNN